MTVRAASQRAAASPRAARIPSLDGLRGVCILLVLWSHLEGCAGFPAMPKWVSGLGDFGLRAFFVISGYLITTLLLHEQKTTGTISLKAFYVRRTYRIFPALYAFVAVVAVLTAARVIVLAPGDMVHALTFTMNYDFHRSWWVGHIWSLSVEEQFYLLWPTVVLLAGVRRALFCAGATLFLAPLARVLIWHYLPGARPGVGEFFSTVCDSIAIGCLLAGARQALDGAPRYLRALRSPFAALLFFVGLCAHQLWRHPSVYLPVGFTAVNVLLVLYIDRVIRFPHSFDGRLLNSRPLEYVGKLSYSIYLWQQLFLDRAAPSAVTTFPVNVALTAVASVVSYYAVERTFLNLRARRARAQ